MSSEDLINQALDLKINLTNYRNRLKDYVDKKEIDYALKNCDTIMHTIGKVNGWLEHRENQKIKEL
jgi:hypothetical protein